jgi:hypothetical protein
MVENSTSVDIDLETFLKSAGQSFSDAQRALLPGVDVPVNMMLSNADLELRVAVTSSAQGKMSIRPISSEDITRGGIDPGLLSTIRISFVSSIGEIKPQPEAPVSSVPGGDAVPTLMGLTLDEAAKVLRSAGWQYEAHAANSDEIASADKESHGRIIRQQPLAGQTLDKTRTTLHFWVNLGSIPVNEIDGIGIKLGDSLSKIGITNIGELSLASTAQVASALRISESRTQAFLDMAGLMSRLVVLGFKDEVVELLVCGAGIRSIDQLADAEPKELYRICKEAITSGKVRVPGEFSLTAEDIRGWIKAAKTYPGK